MTNSASLPAFITIPRPIRRGTDGGYKTSSDAERSGAKLQVYFAPGEKELVKSAAAKCGMTVSEFVRQLTKTAVIALEARSDGHDQHR